jgi:transcriptional regulator with PAS, ATPase and Fis domain
MGITDEASAELEKYSFPGNVRELENIILNTVAQTKDKTFIEHVKLPSSTEERLPEPQFSGDSLITIDDAVKKHIIRVMEHANLNIQKAATILGVSERTLQRRLQEIRKNK